MSFNSRKNDFIVWSEHKENWISSIFIESQNALQQRSFDKSFNKHWNQCEFQ